MLTASQRGFLEKECLNPSGRCAGPVIPKIIYAVLATIGGPTPY